MYFHYPRIDEALQAIHSSNCFSSLNLAQGYLQLAMEESDKKDKHLKPDQWFCMSYVYAIWAIKCWL